MASVRKTRDEWEVQALYSLRYGWEMVTTEDSFKEARARLREYYLNEPLTAFRLKLRRVKINA